jgi:hypothetical protein
MFGLSAGVINGNPHDATGLCSNCGGSRCGRSSRAGGICGGVKVKRADSVSLDDDVDSALFWPSAGDKGRGPPPDTFRRYRVDGVFAKAELEFHRWRFLLRMASSSSPVSGCEQTSFRSVKFGAISCTPAAPLVVRVRDDVAEFIGGM